MLKVLSFGMDFAFNLTRNDQYFYTFVLKILCGKEIKMYLKESKAWMVSGIAFFVVGLLMVFVIIPWQIADVANADVSARFFPRIVCSAMAVLGALLFYHGYRRKDEENQKILGVSKAGLKYIAVTFGILILYVLSLYWVPYIVSTAVALVVLMLFYGQRNWIKLIGVGIGLPVIIYFSFTYLLMLKLP